MKSKELRRYMKIARLGKWLHLTLLTRTSWPGKEALDLSKR
jgi:hypothetical protein